MAVLQLLQVGAINVALHPHPQGIYEELIRFAYSRRKVSNIYGERSGIISQLYTVSEGDKVVALEGVVSTFTLLDPALPWFNANTADDASEEDLGELQLPEHLMPNHRRCQFYFDIASHTWIFDTVPRKGGVAPRSMLKFLQATFMEAEVVAKFGIANLTVVPDAKSVEEVVGWSRIKSLIIKAHRPNPDYDEDDLRDFEESLDSQNADRIELKLVAQPDNYLAPSEKTETIAAIAADNGYVEAHGQNELGQPETRSTKEKKPLTETEYFNPEVEDAWSAFRRFAETVANGIRRQRRQIRSNRALRNGNN